MILAKSQGLVKMVPSNISLVGGPPFVHPNQFFKFFHIELVSEPNLLILFSHHDLFSDFRMLFIEFLSLLYCSQSLLSFVSKALFCAAFLFFIFFFVESEIQGAYLALHYIFFTGTISLRTFEIFSVSRSTA